MLCAFWLGNVLRATTACNFSSLIWPDGSESAALASLLFDPLEPQLIGKTQVFRDFPTFSRTWTFFLLTVSFDPLSSSLLFSSLLFSSLLFSSLLFSSLLFLFSSSSFLFSSLLFSSLLFSYSSHLCFSSVHSVGSWLLNSLRRLEFRFILLSLSNRYETFSIYTDGPKVRMTFWWKDVDVKKNTRVPREKFRRHSNSIYRMG